MLVQCVHETFTSVIFSQDHPDLVKDQFWDEHYPELPYTQAAEDTRVNNPILGSTANVQVRIYYDALVLIVSRYLFLLVYFKRETSSGQKL